MTPKKAKAKGAELVAKLRVLGDVAEQAGLPHLAATLRNDKPFNDDATLRGMLHEDQFVHWQTVRWLVAQNPRGTGRSTLLALAMIAEADENPGVTVNIWDHFRSPEGIDPPRWFRNVVQELLVQLREADAKWKAKEFVLDRRGLRRTPTVRWPKAEGRLK